MEDQASWRRVSLLGNRNEANKRRKLKWSSTLTSGIFKLNTFSLLFQGSFNFLACLVFLYTYAEWKLKFTFLSNAHFLLKDVISFLIKQAFNWQQSEPVKQQCVSCLEEVKVSVSTSWMLAFNHRLPQRKKCTLIYLRQICAVVWNCFIFPLKDLEITCTTSSHVLNCHISTLRKKIRPS